MGGSCLTAAALAADAIRNAVVRLVAISDIFGQVQGVFPTAFQGTPPAVRAKYNIDWGGLWLSWVESYNVELVLPLVAFHMNKAVALAA
jgi:hypothetical protein